MAASRRQPGHPDRGFQPIPARVRGIQALRHVGLCVRNVIPQRRPQVAVCDGGARAHLPQGLRLAVDGRQVQHCIPAQP
eukprot:7600245-Pyramimonas_sp.AAC.1